MKAAVAVYAEDGTISVTAPADIPTIRDHLLTFERAIGACLNTRKSKVKATGSWDTSIKILNLPYYQDITIQCFEIMSTVARSECLSCSRATGRMKALARDT
jgi:hypothetical protein